MRKLLNEELIINVTFHSMLQDIKDYFRISFGSDLICNKILKVRSLRVWEIFIFFMIINIQLKECMFEM